MRLTAEELRVLDTHMVEQGRSGLNITRYCAKHGINYNSFMYHRERRRLVKEGCVGDTQPDSCLPGFVRLDSIEQVEITLGNGIRLSVPVSSIGKVLEALCAR